MQFCGFSSVVGTLWLMADEDEPQIAETLYKHTFRNGDKVDFRDSATALNFATGKMQMQPGMILGRLFTLVHKSIVLFWRVPFISFIPITLLKERPTAIFPTGTIALKRCPAKFTLVFNLLFISSRFIYLFLCLLNTPVLICIQGYRLPCFPV